MSPLDKGEVTVLLDRFGQGDRSALAPLIPLIYNDLRNVARRCLQGDPSGRTMQPTALVHEAYFRLVGQRVARWENRAQFLSIAALLMRRILTSYARRRRAEKRGGAAHQTTFDEAFAAASGELDTVLAVHQALIRLGRIDARQAKFVELRYFGGLTVEEIAVVTGVSEITVKREWRSAKLWLRRELARIGDENCGALAKGQAAV